MRIHGFSVFVASHEHEKNILCNVLRCIIYLSLLNIDTGFYLCKMYFITDGIILVYWEQLRFDSGKIEILPDLSLSL